jgi:hypothetical protein
MQASQEALIAALHNPGGDPDFDCAHRAFNGIITGLQKIS